MAKNRTIGRYARKMRLGRLERYFWRQRSTRMDRVLLSLLDVGPGSAEELASKLKMDSDDVVSLLEDLLLDAIVYKAGNVFFASDDSCVRLH